MEREQYEEVKMRLEEITKRLRDENISSAERDRLEKEGKELTRIVMSPWIPFDWRYRIVMIAIAAIGFWGLIQGNYFFILIWLLLLIFSPRAVGKFLMSIAGFKDL